MLLHLPRSRPMGRRACSMRRRLLVRAVLARTQCGELLRAELCALAVPIQVELWPWRERAVHVESGWIVEEEALLKSAAVKRRQRAARVHARVARAHTPRALACAHHHLATSPIRSSRARQRRLDRGGGRLRRHRRILGHHVRVDRRKSRQRVHGRRRLDRRQRVLVDLRDHRDRGAAAAGKRATTAARRGRVCRVYDRALPPARTAASARPRAAACASSSATVR